MLTTIAPVPDSEDYIIHYDYEDYEPDIYKRIFQISTKLDIYLEMFTIGANLFHLAVLLRKELRSISIYMIMMAISISDIVNFILTFHNSAFELMWIPDFFPDAYYGICLRDDYGQVNPWKQAMRTISDITRRLSVWLAVEMALIRTLSVVFPMSIFIQKLTKPKAAWFFIFGILFFWVVYSTWPFAMFRILWLPDNMSKYCPIDERRKIPKIHLLVAPQFLPYLMSELGFIESIQKLIPAVLYPVLTFSLLVQMRAIKKKRQSMRSNEKEKSPNTNMLILFMTITFMLSEGLAGAIGFAMSNIEAIAKWNEDVSFWVSTLQYPIINLRSLNAASHGLVCYLMSSQYREAMKNMFYDNAYCRNRKKIRKVDQTLTAISKTSRISTMSRSSDY